MLTDNPLVEVFEKFAAPSPIPAGGSAAAIASGLGVSLLRMAAALPRTRTESEEDVAALVAVSSALVSLQQRLTDAINNDAEAYTRVAAAYKLPSGSDHPERQSAIQDALRAAIEVPLEIMRLSACTLTHARTIAARGRRAVVSDIAVAIAALRAGTEGANRIALANLTMLLDKSYVNVVEREAKLLIDQATKAVSATEALLGY